MKKILFGLLALVVTLILGIVIFIMTFDLNHYRHFVETQASNALGRTVEIKSLSTKLSLIPTIKAEGVRILDDTQKDPLLEIPKLEAVIELMPLIQKQIIVQEIKVPEASFIWTKDIKTQASKSTKKSKKTDSKTSTKQSKLWIDFVEIDALQCKIGKESPYNFKINKMTLKELSRFSFDIVYQEKTITVNGNFGSILDLLIQRAELPINLTLVQDKSSLKINGKIADLAHLKKINLQVNASIPNLATFLKSWNIKNTKIPSSALTIKTSFDGDLDKAELGTTTFTLDQSDLVFTTQGTLTKLKENPSAALTATLVLENGAVSKLWGIKPFELETKIATTKNTVALSEMKMNAGRSDLKGNIQLGWEKRPVLVQGKLESTYFEIDDIVESKKEDIPQKTTETTQTKVFTTDKLPFDLLKQINTNVHLNIEHVKFAEEMSDYAAVNGTILVNDGELTMPAQIRLFGGIIQNQLKVQSAEQKVILKTEALNIQLDKMKRLNKNIQNSFLNVSLSLEGRGETLHQLAASAEGNISAELTSGQIVNKWFNTLPTTLNLLRGRGNSLTFSTQDQKTEVLCGAINMPVQKGIIVSKNQIALETNTLNFIVNGQIDLNNETLELSMIPSFSQTRGMANGLLTATQSISLSGPWTDVETKIDTGTAVSNLAQTAVQKLAGQENNAVQAKELCQRVLGRALTKPKKATQSIIQPKEIKKVAVQENEEVDFKNQLIQSLSQVLTAPRKQ